MLRWLPSALYSKSTERQHFLQDLLLLVLGVHVLLLLVMVGVSLFDKKHSNYSISMHQTGATYVLMPLQKKVDQLQKCVERSSQATIQGSRVVNYEDYERRKNKRHVILGQKSKNKIIAKKSKKIVQKYNNLQKSMQKNQATAALVDDHKHYNKKNKVKMVELVVVQPIVAQKVEEQFVAPEIITSPAQEVNVSDVIEAISSDVVSTDDIKNTNEDSFDIDNVVFVGYEQLDECMVGSKIQQAIQQCWTPPIGIAAGTSCKMRVTVSDQGVGQDVKIEKGSEVFVYDTSARMALLQVEYPKEVWNKTITIVLSN